MAPYDNDKLSETCLRWFGWCPMEANNGANEERFFYVGKWG